MKICKVNILIFLVALISLNLNSAFSYEDEKEIQGEDIVVCAQVLPCDEEGNVLEEYRGGACEAQYAQKCSLFFLSQKEASCQDNIQEYEKALDKKSKKIRKLQRRIKRLKK